ncbi:MAG: hypothetical protein GY842_25010 [bacterium]|nr:hypothetical protein [bacterium]
MKNETTWMVVGALACVALSSTGALGTSGDQAAQVFSQGSALLTQGDFDGALNAYREAAKADSSNQEYRQQYSIVRRVIKMRKRIAAEANPSKWEATAQGLRVFYYEHGLHTEALALDQQSYAKTSTAASAARLAETQLELEKNADAVAVLSNLPEDQATPETRVLLGIALAREGDTDQARKIGQGCAPAGDWGPGTLYDLARLRALTGDQSDALKLLVRCFENTLPSRLNAFKDHVRKSKDLGTLVASADFAKVLETKSKVKESSCSSGSSCGKCPSRSKCSSTKSSTHTDDRKP